MNTGAKFIAIVAILAMIVTPFVIGDSDTDGAPAKTKDITVTVSPGDGSGTPFSVSITLGGGESEYWDVYRGSIDISSFSYPGYEPVGFMDRTSSSDDWFVPLDISGAPMSTSCTQLEVIWAPEGTYRFIELTSNPSVTEVNLGDFVVVRSDYNKNLDSWPSWLDFRALTESYINIGYNQTTYGYGYANEAGTFHLSWKSADYAIIDVKKPTVSFSSEGSIIHTETVEPNSTVQPYTPSEREGYTFGGWYTDTTFQTPFDFNTSITSDTTLYAKWIENPITITFMVEGQIYSTLAVPKGSVGVVYTPIMVTGVFAGWYYDSAFTQKYDATRSLDADITLYAYGVPPLIFTSEPNASANIQQVSSYGMFFFDATDSSGRYQIEWDFGDGNTSTDAIAYNTYSAPGVYTVTLKVTNIYGESSTTTYDVIYRDPAAGGGDNDLRYIVIALLCILGGGLVIRRII